MSDGYEYVVELVDRISGPAKSAAQQINGLTDKLKADDAALKKLTAAMAKAQEQGPLTEAETKKFTSAITQKEAALTKTTASLRSNIAAQQAQAKAAKQAGVVAKQAAAAEQLGGGGLNDALMAMGPIAAAAGTALLGFAAAIGTGLYAGAKLALSASDFKGDTLDALEAITGTKEKAQETFDTIRKIAGTVQLSEKDTVKLAQDLLLTGIKNGAQLENTIQAVANLTQVRGEEAGAKLQSIVEKSLTAGTFQIKAKQLVGTGVTIEMLYGNLAKRLGISVAQVAAQMKAGKIAASEGIDALNEEINHKLGGMAAKQLLDIDIQAKKAGDTIAHLFEDVDATPFLEVVRDTIKLFDTSTVSGGAMKWLMTTLFTGLFAASKQVFPYVKAAIFEMVIGGLRLYIAFKPIAAKLREIWSTAEQGAATKTSVVGLVDVIVGLLTVVIVLAGYWLIFASYAIQAWAVVGGAVNAAGETISGVLTWIGGMLAAVFSLDTTSLLGQNIIDGLVGGIEGGAGRVVAALQGVANGAIAGVKETLGIASPSRVMAELGGHTAAGFAMGVEDGTAASQGALETAVTPPSAGGGAAASGPTINVEVTIQAGGASPGEILELLTSQLADKLEEVMMQLGGAKGGT